MMSSLTSTVVVTSITWLFAHYLFPFGTNNIPEELIQLSYGYKRFCDKNNLTDQHCFFKLTNIIEDLDIGVPNGSQFLGEKYAYHIRAGIEKNNDKLEKMEEYMMMQTSSNKKRIENLVENQDEIKSQIYYLQHQLEDCEWNSERLREVIHHSFQNFSDALRSQNVTLSTHIQFIRERHQHDKKEMHAALVSTEANFDTRLDHNSRIITWLKSESEKNHTAVHEDLKLKLDNITFYLVAASLLLGEIYIALVMFCKKPTYHRRTLDVSDLSNTL